MFFEWVIEFFYNYEWERKPYNYDYVSHDNGVLDEIENIYSNL